MANLEKMYGGLAIRYHPPLNKALLGKWIWKFAIEREFLWKWVMTQTFEEEEGGQRSRGVKDSYMLGMWKTIRNWWESIKGRSHFKIGNGRRIKFWKNRWCGNLSLEEAFLSLFSISTAKDSWVAKVWEQVGERGWWGPFQDSFTIGMTTFFSKTVNKFNQERRGW